MREVTQDQVANILNILGVQTGDGLLIHSAIQFLGKPAGGLGVYLDAMRETLGQGGNLAVPAFNFGFARGERYDPKLTPSEGMGVFSEYVRQQPEARRTTHPMQSLAVLGPYSADLAGRDTPAAFDPGSAFERLLELDFKLLLLGADVQAVSMIHYSEQRARVPYRYWKEFTGQVRTDHGWQNRTYRMFVRDLEVDPQLDLRPIQALLQAQNAWQSVLLNYGLVSTCRLADFVAAADHLLARDPWALVGNREQAQQRYRFKNSSRLSSP